MVNSAANELLSEMILCFIDLKTRMCYGHVGMSFLLTIEMCICEQNSQVLLSYCKLMRREAACRR